MDDKTNESDQPQASAKQRRSGASYALIAFVFLLQLATIGYLAWDRYAPSSTIPILSPHTISLTEDLQQLEMRITALEDRQNAPSSSPNEGSIASFNLQQETLKALQAEIDELRGELELQTVTLGPLPDYDTHDLIALRKQVEQDGKRHWQQIQRFAAFDRLKEQILSQSAYSDALESLNALSELPSHWVETLNAHQRGGIASWQQLEAQFISAREALLARPQGGTEEASTWDAITGNLSQLVKIRKTGPAHQGDDLGSILARAEFALSQQDAYATLDELEKLTKEQQAVFADFIADLHGRERILALLPKIRHHLTKLQGE